MAAAMERPVKGSRYGDLWSVSCREEVEIWCLPSGSLRVCFQFHADCPLNARRGIRCINF